MTSFLFPTKSWIAYFLMLTLMPLRSQVPLTASDETTYDFGLIPLGAVIHHTFTIKNQGKKNLVVGKISTSCGCTQIVSFPKQIAAGDQGDFVAAMDHQHTGYTDIAIYIPTGPSLADLHTFHLVGVLVDKPSAPPSATAYITANDAVAAFASHKDIALVDVRSVDLYAQSHAPGALNVAAFALEARQDLKEKSVILFNDGTADPALVSRIDRLTALGFKEVHLLAGGLRAWQLAGGPLDGAVRAPSSNLARLSPSDFYSEQRSANGWLVVAIDKTPASLPTAYPIIHLPLREDPAALVKDLSHDIQGMTSVLHVLVVSDLGGGYDLIESALLKTKIGLPVYYLQGGAHAYSAYSHEQTLSLNPQKGVMDASKASFASNQINGQMVHGGGCASCGH